jgi:hypothetical protein
MSKRSDPLPRRLRERRPAIPMPVLRSEADWEREELALLYAVAIFTAGAVIGALAGTILMWCVLS